MLEAKALGQDQLQAASSRKSGVPSADQRVLKDAQTCIDFTTDGFIAIQLYHAGGVFSQSNVQLLESQMRPKAHKLKSITPSEKVALQS